MDLEPFGRINPCGYAGLEVTSMVELRGGQADSSLDAVQSRLLEHLAAQFGLRLHPAVPPQLATPETQAA